MSHLARTHGFGSLPDHELLARLESTLAHERATTVELLALLDEVERRKLFRSAGYESMYDYCRGAHHMSDDVACHRLRTARAARRFPAVRDMIEDGRLNVSLVSLLARYLTPDNASELIAASVHQSCRSIRAMLARRFPSAEVPTMLVPLGAARACPGEPVALRVPVGTVSGGIGAAQSSTERSAPGTDTPPVTLPVGSVDSPESAPTMGPLSSGLLASQRFALQVTIGQRTHDLLRYAQSLLGDGLAARDVAEVLDRALAAYVEKLERQKLGAGTGISRGSDDPRYVPVAVRREVWERDGGQCTYTSDAGHRCACRGGLQFDHVTPVGKGGDGASAANVRLLCAAHNRHEADRAFGAGFMQAKVDAARGEPHGGPCAPTTFDPVEARILASARGARARGQSPADVLQSREAASRASAELDRMLGRVG